MERQEFIENVLTVVQVLEYPDIGRERLGGGHIVGAGSLETPSSHLAAIVFGVPSGRGRAHVYSVLKTAESTIGMQSFANDKNELHPGDTYQQLPRGPEGYVIDKIVLPGFNMLCILAVPHYPYGTGVTHKTLKVERAS